MPPILLFYISPIFCKLISKNLRIPVIFMHLKYEILIKIYNSFLKNVTNILLLNNYLHLYGNMCVIPLYPGEKL